MLLPFQILTAYARDKLDCLIVESYVLPDEAVYMDLLITMDENDEAYTPFNEENMKQYSFDTNAITEYNSEGFVSMSCHYNDNFTNASSPASIVALAQIVSNRIKKFF